MPWRGEIKANCSVPYCWHCGFLRITFRLSFCHFNFILSYRQRLYLIKPHRRPATAAVARAFSILVGLRRAAPAASSAAFSGGSRPARLRWRRRTAPRTREGAPFGGRRPRAPAAAGLLPRWILHFPGSCCMSLAAPPWAGLRACAPTVDFGCRTVLPVLRAASLHAPYPLTIFDINDEIRSRRLQKMRSSRSAIAASVPLAVSGGDLFLVIGLPRPCAYRTRQLPGFPL